MSTKFLLFSDLDGTMFPLNKKTNQTYLIRLKEYLKKNHIDVCYVTGRRFSLVLNAIKQYNLPEPKYLITDVGTKNYYKKKTWIQDEEWIKVLKKDWPVGTYKKILALSEKINGLIKQGKETQSEFKSSFFVNSTKTSKVLKQLNSELNKLKIKYTLIVSKGKQKSLLVDVLPANASKQKAIKYLTKKIKISRARTVFAGDSGNDFSVFTSRIKSIIVNNAEEKIKAKLKKNAKKKALSPTLYFAKANDVQGVLEGLIHYTFHKKNKGINIQIHSMHGLINHNYSDLGRDEDTGGQVVYVVELAKALSELPGVNNVDLVTRRINDSNYPNYNRKIEYLTKKARIIRVFCGPEKYVKKTKLWPFIDEYVENIIKFNEKEGIIPDILHANYADAGLVCSKLSEKEGIPMVFTAHSLGIPKMQKLGVNSKNKKEFEEKFHFSTRLKAEQKAIDSSETVIVSTKEEAKEQYAGYNTKNIIFEVIPPGLDEKIFYYREERFHEKEIQEKVTKNLNNKKKPIILVISRLDVRKNLEGIVNVFCKSKRLQEKANLVILTGLKKTASKDQQDIYARLKKTIKQYKVEEKVALVKFVDFKNGLGELYRYARKTRGVFVNPAFIEPFGLTILEASACGLPIVSTKNGGPSETITNKTNGLLVNPYRENEIEIEIYELLTNKKLWTKISLEAVKNAQNYSWKQTARKELALFEKIIKKHEV